MKSFLSVLFLASLLAAGSAARAELDVCGNSNGIESISRPVFLVNQSTAFSYKFRYLKGTLDAPVVIFLPGGPGQSSINSFDPRIDSSYGYIQTDPRGVGCNNVAMPLEAISSETLASDVIAVIEHLKLENYILYGISYGTALATRIAFEAAKKGIRPPRALVLEGVLSKAFGLHEAEFNYSSAWEKVRLSLPKDVLQVLSEDPPPLGLQPSQWALWIKGMLSLGKLPSNSFSLESILALLKGTVAERETLKNLIAGSDGPSLEEFRVYKQIACRELYETDYWSTFSGGKIVPDYVSEDACRDTALTQPIDVKAWPFQGTIYYFSGQQDPATPPYMAKYHFDNQPLARKYLIEVQEGGHNSLKVNLSDCAGKIWAEILQDTGRIGDALYTCSLKATVIN